MVFGKFESTEQNCPIENIELTVDSENIGLYIKSDGAFIVTMLQNENFELTATAVGGSSGTFVNIAPVALLNLIVTEPPKEIEEKQDYSDLTELAEPDFGACPQNPPSQSFNYDYCGLHYDLLEAVFNLTAVENGAVTISNLVNYLRAHDIGW